MAEISPEPNLTADAVKFLMLDEVTVSLRSPEKSLDVEIGTNLPDGYRALFLPPVLAGALCVAVREQFEAGNDPWGVVRNVLDLVTGHLLSELRVWTQKGGTGRDTSQDG